MEVRAPFTLQPRCCLRNAYGEGDRISFDDVGRVSNMIVVDMRDQNKINYAESLNWLEFIWTHRITLCPRI
jgi:hypothetical protein